jgi:hypothetical protein
MMLKRIVTITLLTSMILMALILIAGVFLPDSILEKYSKHTNDTATVVVVDKNGKAVLGASVKTNSDGTTTVTDQNGKVIDATVTESASTTTAPVITPPSTPTVPSTPTTPTTPTQPTTPTTPAPPAPVYCGGKTDHPCYGKSDLAAHASTSNCWGFNKDWMIDLSGYAPKHPDGANKVITTAACGKDIAGILGGTVSSNGTHNHKSATKTNSSTSQLKSSMIGYYDASKP